MPQGVRHVPPKCQNGAKTVSERPPGAEKMNASGRPDDRCGFESACHFPLRKYKNILRRENQKPISQLNFQQPAKPAAENMTTCRDKDVMLRGRRQGAQPLGYLFERSKEHNVHGDPGQSGGHRWSSNSRNSKNMKLEVPLMLGKANPIPDLSKPIRMVF